MFILSKPGSLKKFDKLDLEKYEKFVVSLLKYLLR